MRVTAEQKQAMSGAAARDGLELSAWLRQLGASRSRSGP